MLVLGVDGSPQGAGRTAVVVAAVLEGAGAAGARTRSVALAAPGGLEEALRAAEAADAFVLGSPTYRASYAAPLKAFLDALPRGMWGEATAPVTGRAVAIVATGATWHHFLGPLRDLREVLAGFFAAHVLPPGLYVPREAFTDDGKLSPPVAELATGTGVALVALATAIKTSPELAGVRPQA